ncbi:hypothetical protein VZT92_015196 [Zoarces viviparus]|uniref:Tektin n=1 Tax=Zoarces viviparus TaxID=48416 RepID=A0AAW1EV93_ZOAVI
MSDPDHSPNLGNYEIMRNRSELFRAECTRLMLETDEACKRMPNDDGRRLNQRLGDIQFVKKGLELKLKAIILEIDALEVLQSRVAKAMKACEEPLKVTMVCMEERKKRPPSERLHDKVERELLEETKAIERVASLLLSVAQQITEQIRLNRSAKYQLEKDLKDKFEAQCIDSSCALLTHDSIDTASDLQRSNAKLVPQRLAVTSKQWQNISDINMAKAEQQLANSLSLRSLVESILVQTAYDIQKQVQATAAALQLSVLEIKSAKSQMEDQLAKILSEFDSQQRLRENLRVAIAEGEQGLSLVQARLALRCQRPGKEQCHDAAQSHLLAEVQQLTAHINTLQEAAARSDDEQRSLVHCQLELQESIDMMASCLYIDEVVCPQHKKSIVIHNF